MSESLADLFVLLRAETAGFTGPLLEAAKAAEDVAAKIVASVERINVAFVEMSAAAKTAASEIAVAEADMTASVEAAAAKQKLAAEETVAAQRGVATESKLTSDAVAASSVKQSEAVAAGAASTAASAEKSKGAAATTEASYAGAGAAVVKGMAVAGVATAGFAAVSVDMASKFQTQMTRLYTAAGAPKEAVQAATGQILQMGTAVGMTGTQMAEALYHPISAGLDLNSALQVVKYSAEEAQISGASLDDTTYSLSSVMKAFNQSAADAGPTMASLNAIVGQGDMRFQDFNASIKNWAPTAAEMGISINSMGAGLAYLTDRGNSAEVAATRMTMGISMMTTPSAKATKLLEGLGLASSDVKASSDAMTEVLKKTGITQNKLAEDLKQPDGLYVALTDLKTKLQDAGVSGTAADSVLAKIFGGGRSDKAILSLMQNLDGVKTKFDDITKASSMDQFNKNWADTTNNFSFKMDQMKAGIENLAISFGSYLLPKLTDFITLMQGAGSTAFAQIALGFNGPVAPAAVSAGNLRLADQAGMSSTDPASSISPGALRAGEISATPGTKSLTSPAALRAMENASIPPPVPPSYFEQIGQKLANVARDWQSFIDDITKSTSGLWDKIRPVAETIGKGFVDSLDHLITIGHNLYDAFKPALDQWGSIAGGAIAGAVDFLSNTVLPAFEGITGWMKDNQGVVTFFTDVVLGPFVAKLLLMNTIKTVTFLAGLAGDVLMFPVNSLKGIASSFGKVKDAVLNGWDKLTDWVAKITGVGRAAEMSASERELAAENAARAAETAATQEQSAAEKTATVVEDSTAKMTAAFEELVTKAKTTGEEVGKSIAAGIRQGISDGLSQAVESARELAEKVILAVKEALGIAPPSRKMIEAGINIDQGLAQGIRDDMEAAVLAGREMATAVVAAVDAETALVRPVVVRTVTEGGGAAAAEGEAAGGAAVAGAAAKKGIGGKLIGAAGTVLGVAMVAQTADSMLPKNTPEQDKNGATPFASPQAYADHGRTELAGISAAVSDPGSALDDMKKQFAAFPDEFQKGPFMTWARGLGKTISGAIGDAGSWLKKTGTDMWHGFWDNGVLKAFDATVSWFKGLSGKVKGWLSGAGTWIVDHGKALWTGFWDHGVVPKFQDTVAWFKALPGKVRGWLSDAKTWIVTHGKELWTGFWDNGVVVKFNDTVSWFKALPGKVKGWLSDAGSWITSHGKALWTGFWDNGVVPKFQDTVRWFQDLPGKVKGWLSGAGDWLVSAGRDLVNGLWNGISAGWSWLTSQVSNLASNLLSAAKSVLGIKSPSTETHAMGRYLVEGLVGGINADAHLAEAAVAAMGRNVLSASRIGLAGVAIGGDGASLSSTAALSVASRAAALTSQAGGVSGGDVHVHINAAGSILTDQDLARMIQEWLLRYGVRNSGSGITYAGFGSGR